MKLFRGYLKANAAKRICAITGVVFVMWAGIERLDADQTSQESQSVASGKGFSSVESRMTDAFERIEQMLNHGDLKSAASTIDGIRQLGTSGDLEELAFGRLRLRWHDMAKEAKLVVEGSVLPKFSEVRVDGVKVTDGFPITLKGYGRHMLVFSCDGYETFERAIDVDAMYGRFSLGPISLIRRYTLEKPTDDEQEGGSAAAEPRKASDGDVRAVVEKWRTAWQVGDMEAYASFYDDAFSGREFSTYTGWQKYPKSEWMNKKIVKSKWSKKPTLTVENLRIVGRVGGVVSVCFDQNYKSGGFSERGIKTMSFVTTKDGTLLITKEVFVPAMVPMPVGKGGANDEPYRQFVDKWKRVCESGSLGDYDALYAPKFTGRLHTGKGLKALKRSEWMNEQAKLFSESGNAVIQLADLLVCDDHEMQGVKLVMFRETRRSGGVSKITDRAFRIRADSLGRMLIFAEICQVDTTHLAGR
ncbi:MAG: hypothetical protein ACK49N_09300 [Verrucomicrobiota bacterium]